ncbi:MAG: DUF4347 domain-containing protein, partial [Bacteroidota bacterium]
MNRKHSASRNQTNSAQKSGLKRSKPAPLALEARLMFDGAAVATAVADAAPAPDTHVAEHAAEAPAAAQTDASREGAQVAEHAVVKEIVFIDAGVSNWQILAAGVNPDAEVVMLDPTRDGLTQIAEALQGKSGLDAIHIVSHGTEGGIILGGTTFTADALAQHQGDLAAIGSSLTESGDILIYGCDVAEGSVGEAFVSAVASATQADVAASDNATGSAALGGDWKLEYSTGSIDVAALHIDRYQGLLDSVNVAEFGTVTGDLAPISAQLYSYQDSNGSLHQFNNNNQISISGSYGSLTIQRNGDYTYVSNVNVTGNVTDTFHYKATSSGPLLSLDVHITAASNVAPVAIADTATVAEDGSVNINVLGNDSAGPANEAGQTLTVTAASALHGTVAINADGTLSYSPNANYNGADTISYTIRDNGQTNGVNDFKTASSTV